MGWGGTISPKDTLGCNPCGGRGITLPQKVQPVWQGPGRLPVVGETATTADTALPRFHVHLRTLDFYGREAGRPFAHLAVRFFV